jgi:hypothetical protein
MEAIETIKIWLLCIFAAIGYGIVHDQITVRVCVEYFSVFHPTILPLTSPTLLALQWGILATWWVGAGLGALLALAARAGRRSKLPARELRRPLLILLACMAASSLAAGTAGFLLAGTHKISPPAWMAVILPVEQRPRFMADWWAHSASYLVGMIGGLVVCIRTYLKRGLVPGSTA